MTPETRVCIVRRIEKPTEGTLSTRFDDAPGIAHSTHHRKTNANTSSQPDRRHEGLRLSNLRVASSRGIHGAMRKRIPTRADSPLCMGAPRRSPVFSACQAAASGYALSRLGGLRFAFDSSSESSIQRSVSSLNLRKFASSARIALRCSGRTYSERLRIWCV